MHMLYIDIQRLAGVPCKFLQFPVISECIDLRIPLLLPKIYVATCMAVRVTNKYAHEARRFAQMWRYLVMHFM